MYVIHTIEDFNINDIYFNKSVNNTVITNGKFTRVLFSNSLYTINSLLYLINFNNITIEQSYNKYKCYFSQEKYKNLRSNIRNIENTILETTSIKKEKKFCISNQLDTGCIRLFENSMPERDKNFILKISGIWETDTDYGLTYKFMLMKPLQ